MKSFNKPYWVMWGIELWERFGFYGMQAIITLYFVQQLGFSQIQSFYLFGSFSAFLWGFNWFGGYIGDYYLGAKRTLVLGAIVLMFSYAALAMVRHDAVFYALAGIVVGNALFKANPSSLISKLYAKGDPLLDGAFTMYYMAINIGSLISMALTPIIAVRFGWSYAYWLCSFGLLIGLINYFCFRSALISVATVADKESFSLQRLLIVILGAFFAFLIIAKLLPHTRVCTIIVYTVVGCGYLYFLKIAFSLPSRERARMLIAFVLILQAIVFFVLYNQMPMSLTFFALHNVNNNFMGWQIPPAEYQLLNPLVIILMSPLLSIFYKRVKSTHSTKFCLGMTLSALAFLVLYLPKFMATNGLVSPWWMVLTYFLQSTGELLISGLGLPMVAELCPESKSGFVMGVWFLSTMLSGPIAAWVSALTAPKGNLSQFEAVQSLGVYTHIFLLIGVVTGAVAILMWLMRSRLNRYI